MSNYLKDYLHLTEILVIIWNPISMRFLKTESCKILKEKVQVRPKYSNKRANIDFFFFFKKEEEEEEEEE